MSDRRLIRATALLFCLRFLAASLIDLAPQETYYWNYAQHPALSYFDHPPMIAWVISAGQFLLGKNALGVRLGGLLLTLLSTWLLYTLGRFWFNRRAGLWAALLFQLIPLYFVYGLLITPDVPLIFFWLLTLYLVSLAVRGEKKWVWYLAGAALGFCLLSKYTAIFLVPSTLLWLILDRCHREWLTRKEPYLALLIAALFFTPVILWNVEHDWASFGFQVSDRLHRAPSHPLKSLGEFLLTQLGVTSPILLAGLLMLPALPVSYALSDWRLRWRFCFLFSIPILAFMLLFSIRSGVKANWTLPGYLSLLVAAYPCYRYFRFNSGARKLRVVRYFLLSFFYTLPVLYVVAVYHLTLTIPGIPAHSFTTGWKELGQAVGREARAFEVAGGKKVFLLGLDSHYIAAALSFYSDDSREVFSRNVVGKNALAFDYWRPKIDLAGFNALAVDGNPPELDALRKYFVRVDENIKRLPVMMDGRILGHFYVVKCFGYMRPDARPVMVSEMIEGD
jgi:dolichol-phosphate mannosyltransferase